MWSPRDQIRLNSRRGVKRNTAVAQMQCLPIVAPRKQRGPAAGPGGVSHREAPALGPALPAAAFARTRFSRLAIGPQRWPRS